jgi:EAL domain-containing protein (putative c-di-GMP-specific phosphodiesterase class I)
LHVVDIAARHHLLTEFEWCTLHAVVRDIARCAGHGMPLPLAVNISAASMGVPGFAQRVADLLRSLKAPGRLLAVEITETSPVPDIDTVRDNMQQLHAMGVRLSLDDFGTGYSALSLLAKFPFSEVKVDPSMVARLDQPRMQAAVSLAHESARRYNATLIAEGIETRSQCERLRELGLEYGQGYLFSRAVPIERMLAFGPVLPDGLAPALAA